MNRDKNVYRVVERLRKGMGENDKEIVLAVLKKTMELQKSQTGDVDDDRIYELMRDSADEFRVPNPFESRDEFFELYSAIHDYGEFSWRSILEEGRNHGRYGVVMDSLVEVMTNQCEVMPGKILVAEADRFASSLNGLIEKYSAANFTLVSREYLTFRILCEMFAGDDRVEVVQADVGERQFTAEKFDMILAFPVTGGRMQSGEGFICHNYDMAVIENLSCYLEPGGFLSVATLAKIACLGGRVQKLRLFLQRERCLKYISEFPVKSVGRPVAPLYLITMTTGRTGNVNVRKYGEEDGNLLVEKEVGVSRDELEEAGNWNISFLIESQDDEWVRFRESTVDKARLGEKAAVFRGKSIFKKSEGGRIGVINVANVGENEVDFSGIDFIDEDERKVASYLLMDGDLLMTARGTVIRTAIFRAQEFPCIASSNLIVIRPNDDGLLTPYLKMFLDSSLGRKKLNANQMDSALINISHNYLVGLEIPAPSTEKQKKLSDEYLREYGIYKETVRKARDRWNGTLEKLGNDFKW